MVGVDTTGAQEQARRPESLRGARDGAEVAGILEGVEIDPGHPAFTAERRCPGQEVGTRGPVDLTERQQTSRRVGIADPGEGLLRKDLDRARNPLEERRPIGLGPVLVRDEKGLELHPGVKSGFQEVGSLEEDSVRLLVAEAPDTMEDLPDSRRGHDVQS